MALTQGAPLPNITTTDTSVQKAPQFYTDYLTGLSTAASTAMARPAAEAIAGYDPLQTAGYGQMQTAADAYKPGLSAAESTLGKAAQGVTGARISELMNPYTNQVVNEMERLQQQSMQRSLLPTMKAGFVGSGGLGSQRYAGALGQALADAQRNLTGQQAAALQAGFSEAQKTALGELPFLVQAGQQQLSGAKLGQELGLTGAGALTKAGAEKQAYEQSLRDYPLQTATTAAGLLRGYPIQLDETKTRVGPGQAGQYQKSPLENVLGLVSMLGAASGATTIGPDGKPVQSPLGAGLNRLVDIGKGILGGFGGTSFTIDPKEFIGAATEGGPGLYFDRDTYQYYDSSGNLVPISGSEGE